VHTITSWAANYLLYVVALGALLGWLPLPRTGKVLLATQVVIGALLVWALVKSAGVLHGDPRPFEVNPRLHPLIAHSADNGFPSDHTTLAAMVGGVVATHRRWLGAVLLALAVLLGAARIAAHVHHVQDVAGGLVLGLLAAALAVLLTQRAAHWIRARKPATSVS
jgi:membrane-associated phospholipid phosphatase